MIQIAYVRMKHILSYTLLACTLLPVSPLVAQMTVNAIAPVSPVPVSALPSWADPLHASEGKATPRQEFISYSSRELAEKDDMNDAPHYLPLAGKWRVNYSTTAQGGEAGFYQPRFSIAGWDETDLPNAAKAAGISPLAGLVPPQLPAENPLVQYRAAFDVPYLWLDRDMYIHIEGVGSAYALYINGQRVGYSNDSRTPAEYNISDAVTDGINSIAIEVYGFSQGSWMETSIPPLVAGTLGNIYIYSQPKLRIEDFVVRAKLDSARVNGIVWITAIMSNSYRSAEKITFGYDIYSPEGKLLTYNMLETEVEPEGYDTLRFKEYIYPSVKKMWSPQAPNLYRMMLYVRRDGRITEYIPFKFGFNITELEDGVLVINGRKAELNIAVYKAAADEAATTSELRSLKQQKYNTVCVSYPQPRWFYELCDKIGIYVIDQANINSGYRKDDRNVGGAVANDPRFLPDFIDRVAYMRGRSKNYTSLIALSMGGESGNGYNFYKAYQWLKGADTLHPVTYRDVQGEWNSDFSFPGAEDVQRFLNENSVVRKNPKNARR